MASIREQGLSFENLIQRGRNKVGERTSGEGSSIEFAHGLIPAVEQSVADTANSVSTAIPSLQGAVFDGVVSRTIGDRLSVSRQSMAKSEAFWTALENPPIVPESRGARLVSAARRILPYKNGNGSK